MEEFKIAEQIRIQRQRKGISQEAMAFYLNMSQTGYSKMERGETKITIDRIYEIAEILEISAFILLPKPKYGTGINFLGIRRAFDRLGNFLRLKKRKSD